MNSISMQLTPYLQVTFRLSACCACCWLCAIVSGCFAPVRDITSVLHNRTTIVQVCCGSGSFSGGAQSGSAARVTLVCGTHSGSLLRCSRQCTLRCSWACRSSTSMAAASLIGSLFWAFHTSKRCKSCRCVPPGAACACVMTMKRAVTSSVQRSEPWEAKLQHGAPVMQRNSIDSCVREMLV